MSVVADYINVHTNGNCHIVDLTSELCAILVKSGIKDGMVCVFVPGATGALTTIEYEPGLIKDIRELLEKIIPQNKSYHHDRTWHDGNGHSHLRASLLGPSITVPVIRGKMTLGTWQQIIFLDLDNRSRTRQLVVQIMGE